MIDGKDIQFLRGAFQRCFMEGWEPAYRHLDRREAQEAAIEFVDRVIIGKPPTIGKPKDEDHD